MLVLAVGQDGRHPERSPTRDFNLRGAGVTACPLPCAADAVPWVSPFRTASAAFSLWLVAATPPSTPQLSFDLPVGSRSVTVGRCPRGMAVWRRASQRSPSASAAALRAAVGTTTRTRVSATTRACICISGPCVLGLNIDRGQGANFFEHGLQESRRGRQPSRPKLGHPLVEFLRIGRSRHRHAAADQ